MSSIWNLMTPLRTGSLPLQNSGRELFGTVIKDGLNKKTVTVIVNYNKRQKQTTNFGIKNTYVVRSNNFLVHDEESFSKTGDKLYIPNQSQGCQQGLSKIKNVVKQFPKSDYYQSLTKETQSEQFQDEYKKLYQSYLTKQLEKSQFKNKKQEAEVKSSIKIKAMSESQQNLRKFENVREGSK